MIKEKAKLPMNIQFFAEATDQGNEPPANDEGTGTGTELQTGSEGADPGAELQTGGDGTDPGAESDNAPTVQELLVELAKVKRAQEKAASEAAEYKKKYNAKLSEKEKIDAEKAEREAEKEQKFQELLRENRINRLEKSYLALRYTPEEAGQMAVAEVDGDEDAKIKIMRLVDERKKREYEAEFIKNRPQVNVGNGAGKEEEDPFLKGFGSVENKYMAKAGGKK